jgi:hypothetical protein
MCFLRTFAELMRKQSEERRERLKWMFEAKGKPQKLLENNTDDNTDDSTDEPKLIEGSNSNDGGQPSSSKVMLY